eukprot:TRINITY_DN134507_c0_g1_i1.p1 TRINITY_DN134507_c0_g1~~TRINITY_DN134507_c0_g1_i1.p1  ORF type:complete len:188 (-),score=18.14 TRINITY_DN134507_c0_g1_i1:20-583(-)
MSYRERGERRYSPIRDRGRYERDRDRDANYSSSRDRERERYKDRERVYDRDRYYDRERRREYRSPVRHDRDRDRENLNERKERSISPRREQESPRAPKGLDKSEVFKEIRKPASPTRQRIDDFESFILRSRAEQIKIEEKMTDNDIEIARVKLALEIAEIQEEGISLKLLDIKSRAEKLINSKWEKY